MEKNPQEFCVFLFFSPKNKFPSNRNYQPRHCGGWGSGGGKGDGSGGCSGGRGCGNDSGSSTIGGLVEKFPASFFLRKFLGEHALL